jgi:hypothetical protein
LVEL